MFSAESLHHKDSNMFRRFNKFHYVSTWVGDQIRIPRVAITFFFLFPLPFPRRYKGLQNCHPCVISFLLFINFLFLISPWPYLYVIYRHYRSINKQRAGQVARILLNSLINRKFIQLVNVVTFSVFFFFFGNRSSMVKPVSAGSSGK